MGISFSLASSFPLPAFLASFLLHPKGDRGLIVSGWTCAHISSTLTNCFSSIVFNSARIFLDPLLMNKHFVSRRVCALLRPERKKRSPSNALFLRFFLMSVFITHLLPIHFRKRQLTLKWRRRRCVCSTLGTILSGCLFLLFRVHSGFFFPAFFLSVAWPSLFQKLTQDAEFGDFDLLHLQHRRLLFVCFWHTWAVNEQSVEIVLKNDFFNFKNTESAN